MFEVLHPELAQERAADCVGQAYMTIDGRPAIIVNAELPTADESFARAIRHAWWHAHYWGVPSRKDERNIALLRSLAVEGLSDEDKVRMLEATMGDDGQRRAPNPRAGGRSRTPARGDSPSR